MWGKDSASAVLGGWNLIYGAKSTKEKVAILVAEIIPKQIVHIFCPAYFT
jgi:penicillin-binding protein-related factor A (putative recombinase)